MHLNNVITTPISTEKMFLIYSNSEIYKKNISPKDLDITKEVRLSWNQHYKSWHDYWFGVHTKEKILVDNMSLMENLIIETNGWAIVPASVVFYLKNNEKISTTTLANPPPNRNCYVIFHNNFQNKSNNTLVINEFNDILNEINKM